MAQAGWHSCSKLSPSISSSKQLPPPCSARKTKPLQGKGEEGWMLQALVLGSQCFSTLALPCEFAGAQNLGSDLMTKMEPISCWTGWCILIVVSPPAAQCQEDVKAEEDAGDKVFITFLRPNTYYLPSYPQKCYDQLPKVLAAARRERCGSSESQQ